MANNLANLCRYSLYFAGLYFGFYAMTSMYRRYIRKPRPSPSHRIEEKPKALPSPKVFTTPEFADVLAVKNYFHDTHKIPIEVVDMIIDAAEYWPCSSVKTSRAKRAIGGRGENIFILRSLPIGCPLALAPASDPRRASYPTENTPSPLQPQPQAGLDAETMAVNGRALGSWAARSSIRGVYPCRKIVFHIESHDQGWATEGAHGGYDGSYTWFDAGCERLEARRIGPSNLVSHETEDDVIAVAGGSDGGGGEGSGSGSGSSGGGGSSSSGARRRNGGGRRKGSFAHPGGDGGLGSEDLTMDIGSTNYHDEDGDGGVAADTSAAGAVAGVAAGAGGPSYVFSIRNLSPEIVRDPPTTRFNHPCMPDGRRIASNRVADKTTQRRDIVWSCTDDVDPDSLEGARLEMEEGCGRGSMTGEFVRGLQLGDVVTVWARARFPGWSNFVDEVRMDVYWAV